MRYIAHITTVLAFVAVLSGTFSKLMIETAFFLQKDYIVKVKCENKNRPWLKCQGKCYLKKQLERDEQRNSKTSTFEKFNITWCQAKVVQWLGTPAQPVACFGNQHLHIALPGFIKRLDRPPIC